jgi:O-antigen/teichoic acid export membrane protein
MIVWLRFEVALYVPIASQLIGNTVVMLIMALNYKIRLFEVKKDELRKILHFGIPVAFSSLLFYLLNTSDQLIMKHLGSLYDVGIYGFGSKISMIIQSLLIVPFSMIWAQLRMKYKNSEGFDGFMTFVGSYYVLIASTVALTFIFFGKELIAIASLGNEEYVAALRYIPFLIFAQIIYSSHMMFDFGIQIKNKTKYYAYICGITLIINLLANYFGIKHLGPSSAPIIKLVTYTLYFFMILIVSQQLYKVKFEKRTLIVVVLSALMVAIFLSYAIEVSLLYRILIIVCYCTILLPLFVSKGEKAKINAFISK